MGVDCIGKLLEGYSRTCKHKGIGMLHRVNEEQYTDGTNGPIDAIFISSIQKRDWTIVEVTSIL